MAQPRPHARAGDTQTSGTMREQHGWRPNSLVAEQGCRSPRHVHVCFFLCVVHVCFFVLFMCVFLCCSFVFFMCCSCVCVFYVLFMCVFFLCCSCVCVFLCLLFMCVFLCCSCVFFLCCSCVFFCVVHVCVFSVLFMCVCFFVLFMCFFFVLFMCVFLCCSCVCVCVCVCVFCVRVFFFGSCVFFVRVFFFCSCVFFWATSQEPIPSFICPCGHLSGIPRYVGSTGASISWAYSYAGTYRALNPPAGVGGRASTCRAGSLWRSQVPRPSVLFCRPAPLRSFWCSYFLDSDQHDGEDLPERDR